MTHLVIVLSNKFEVISWEDYQTQYEPLPKEQQPVVWHTGTEEECRKYIFHNEGNEVA